MKTGFQYLLITHLKEKKEIMIKVQVLGFTPMRTNTKKLTKGDTSCTDVLFYLQTNRNYYINTLAHPRSYKTHLNLISVIH